MHAFSRAIVQLMLLTFLVAPALVQAQKAPQAAPLLDRPAFSLSAAELLSLRGTKPPAGLDVEVMLDETILRFDAKGLLSTEFHSIYRTRSDEGAKSWGNIRASYVPWHEQAPQIRARVVTKEGAFFELDPKTLVEASAAQTGGNVYSDRKEISGPLPAVRHGSVVETRTIVREHKPLFEAGRLLRPTFGVSAYTSEVRVIVHAPTSLALKIRGRATAPKPIVTTVGGERITKFVMRDVLPFSEWPAAQDPSKTFLAGLEISSASSWNAVAAHYASLVEQELARFDAKRELSLALVKDDESLQHKAEKLLAHLHSQVRYTGLELGERSIRPNPPQDTLDRHYGDCKDKSTLLVGLFRAAGIDANVALLNVGATTDVPEDMPGFGVFDHAIVQYDLKDGKGSRFIDATDPYAALGVLAFSDQDRLALVASPSTKALVRIARTTPALSGYEEEVRVNFTELGKAKVTEVSRGTGAFDAMLRASFDDSEESIKERVKGYAKERYDAVVEGISAAHASDLTKPFELTIAAGESEQFETFDNGGYVSLTAYRLYANLPEKLFATPHSKKSDDEKKKEEEAKDPRFIEPPKTAVYLERAHQARVRYRLTVPDGFAFHTLPDALDIEAEGIRVSRHAKSISAREAEVVFQVETATKLVKPEKLEAVREALHRCDQESSFTLRFVHVAREAVERKEARQALEEHQRLLALYPKSVPVISRYAQDLLRMGFGLSARKVAAQLVKDQPKSARAQWTLGYVSLFDEIGRDSYPGADFAGAETALRKAVALEPEESMYYRAFAPVLKRVAMRSRPLDVKRLAELTALYESLRSKFGDHSFDAELLRAQLFRRAYAEVKKLAPELEATAERNGTWVAAVAATEGAEAAARKAAQLAGGDPKELLTTGVVWLVAVGEYAPALKMARLPAVERELEALSRTLDAATRREQCVTALNPPARHAYDWLAKSLSKVDDVEDPEWGDKEIRDPARDSISLRILSTSLLGKVNIFGKSGASLGVGLAVDALPCFLRWDTEEQGTAVRIRLFEPGQATSDRTDTVYLRKAKGGYQVIGARVDRRTIPYSRAMYLALAENKIDEAKVWLGWAKPIVDPMGGFKTKTDFYDAVKALWPSDVSQAKASDLTVLAAAMGAGVGNDSRENKALEAALKSAGANHERARALRVILSASVGRLEPQRVIEFTTPLRGEFPEDKDLWNRHLRALLAARKHAELASELAAFQTRYPDDHTPVFFRNEIDRREGRYAEVVTRSLAAIEANTADRSDLNNAAWGGLFERGDVGRSVNLAERACTPREDASFSALHTLATLYAAAGKSNEAYDYMKASLDKSKSLHVRGADWLLVGMVAEQLGLRELASEAYRRVEKPDYIEETSSYALAQKRLKLSGAARGKQPTPNTESGPGGRQASAAE